MVYCSCGKGIDKVPDWMASITVEFVCKDCPNRQTKSIAFVQLGDVPEETPAEVRARAYRGIRTLETVDSAAAGRLKNLFAEALASGQPEKMRAVLKQIEAELAQKR